MDTPTLAMALFASLPFSLILVSLLTFLSLTHTHVYCQIPATLLLARHQRLPHCCLTSLRNGYWNMSCDSVFTSKSWIRIQAWNGQPHLPHQTQSFVGLSYFPVFLSIIPWICRYICGCISLRVFSFIFSTSQCASKLTVNGGEKWVWWCRCDDILILTSLCLFLYLSILPLLKHCVIKWPTSVHPKRAVFFL